MVFAGYRRGYSLLSVSLASLLLIVVAGCGSGNKDNQSPTVDKVVFTSNRDGNSEIYIMDSNGSRQRRLTNNPERDFQPTLRPDRQEIVFTTRRDGDFE